MRSKLAETDNAHIGCARAFCGAVELGSDCNGSRWRSWIGRQSLTWISPLWLTSWPLLAACQAWKRCFSCSARRLLCMEELAFKGWQLESTSQSTGKEVVPNEKRIADCWLPSGTVIHHLYLWSLRGWIDDKDCKQGSVLGEYLANVSMIREDRQDYSRLRELWRFWIYSTICNPFIRSFIGVISLHL